MTQFPLQRTTADFWQMLWEQNVPSIIALTEKNEDIKVCIDFCYLSVIINFSFVDNICNFGIFSKFENTI